MIRTTSSMSQREQRSDDSTSDDRAHPDTSVERSSRRFAGESEYRGVGCIGDTADGEAEFVFQVCDS